jgi:hypothetical protein
VKASQFLLAEFVEWVCRTYAGSVTSWWRSPRRNLAKGGVHDSLHVSGEAADVVYDGEPPHVGDLEMVAAAYFVEVVREGDHDHFESRLAHLGRPLTGRG